MQSWVVVTALAGILASSSIVEVPIVRGRNRARDIVSNSLS